MSTRRQRRILLIAASLLIASLLTGLLFHRDVAVQYHRARLHSDARYLLTLAAAPQHSPAGQALAAYLKTAAGQQQLQLVFVRELLDHVRGAAAPGARTGTLEPNDWDDLWLELRRLHYDGPGEEWWVVYSAATDSGRRTTGSVRARRPLAALERRMVERETGSLRPVSLVEYPEFELSLLASEVEPGGLRCHLRRVR